MKRVTGSVNIDAENFFRGCVRAICLLTLVLFFAGCSRESTTPEPHLLVGDADQLLITGIDGSVVQKIGLPTLEAKWSPDGTQIAFRDESKFGILTISTKEVETLWQTTADWVRPRIAWSPDGTQVAYIDTDQAHNDHIYIFDLKNLVATPLSWPCGKNCGSPTWQVDGASINYIEDFLFSDEPKVSSRVDQLSLQTGISHTLFTLAHDTQAVRWSHDNNQIVLLSRNYGTFLQNKEGVETKIISGGYFDFCWLPDDKNLVITVADGQTPAETDILTYNLESKTLHTIYLPQLSDPNLHGFIYDCR